VRINFTLNGDRVSCDVDPRKKLSLILHDDFSMLSVRTSCKAGMCGMCTVIMEDEAFPSCLIPAFMVQEKSVLTFEGLKEMKEYNYIIKAFDFSDYYPCDYCFPSKSLIIYSLLLHNLHPDEDEIIDTMMSNICSCDVTAPLLRSIITASRLKRESSYGR